ncbi:MAG: sugar ABC transporter permease [Anaerolineae bacterium]|nr:sugar ABC transporter permease [Anaerolineae bacterium]
MNRLTTFIYSRKAAPWVFLAPFLILFLVFKVFPVVLAVLMSFQKIQGINTGEFNGVANYEALASNVRFGVALRNTTLYTVGTLIVLIPIPLIIAVLLDSGRVVKATVFRTILFLPALTSLVVVGTVFRAVLNPTGLLNSAIEQVGAQPQRWLEVAELAIPSLILLAAWRWTGINIIYFSSGLVNISKEIYEAAAIDGANAFQMFWRITLPLLRPTTLFVVILTIIGGFQVFVEPYILYPGGQSPGDGGLSLAYLIYRTAFNSFNLGSAAAMGVVLALIIFILSLIQFRFFGAFQREG